MGQKRPRTSDSASSSTDHGNQKKRHSRIPRSQEGSDGGNAAPNAQTPTRPRMPLRSEISNVNSSASWLRARLTDARHEDKNCWHRFYIPQRARDGLIEEEIVQKILLETFGDEENTEEIAKNVCKGSRTIFAILVLIKKEAEIQRLFDEGINDNLLPLQRQNGDKEFYLQKYDTSVPVLSQWDRDDRENFHRIQSWFTVPIFEDLEHYELPENCMLPVIELPEGYCPPQSQGGYSDVYPVRIHPAHHRWSAIVDPKFEGPLVAVKRLHQSDEHEFKKEKDILTRLTPKKHPHLVKLLSTYRQGEKWHLMFPFADANLRTYWNEHKNPQFNRQTLLWSLKQMAGIACALTKVHEFRVTEHLTVPENVDAPDGSLRIKKNEQLYGRHGDIKPENFLWFKNVPDLDDRDGVLQLADFGLGRFHGRDSRSRTNPSSVPFSPTYEPPECKTGRPVSRAYDIWSLGCVYLEFVTWLVLGASEIETFSECRGEKNELEINDDNFFTILSNKQAVVRSGVSIWVDNLHLHHRSSQLIHDLLDLIMTHMIVVDTRRRIKSSELRNRLNKLVKRATNDDGYTLTPVPYIES